MTDDKKNESLETTTSEEVTVRKIEGENGKAAVFEFQGKIKDLILADLTKSYLTTGRYTQDSRSISPQGMMSLLSTGVAVGGGALSTALSSTLFMATANPASLMKIGNGVGSAVMGVHGITAQAAFLPVASSLPVVAPLLAMEALNSAMMMQQFQQVDKKLDSIKNSLDIAMARSEATLTGQLIEASRVVDEIHNQYEFSGDFSQDMLIRLALAEHDAGSLVERLKYLVSSTDVTNIEDPKEAERANFDAHSAMLASFVDLRIAYLRICVDMQENPKCLTASIENLKQKISADISFWEELMKRSQKFRTAISQQEKHLQDMNWAERFLPEFVGGAGAADERKIETLKKAYVSTLENERSLMDNFNSLIQSAKDSLKNLEKYNDETNTPSLVYWKDSQGEHSFSTNELEVF
jgi:hypothetical protein